MWFKHQFVLYCIIFLNKADNVSYAFMLGMIYNSCYLNLLYIPKVSMSSGFSQCMLIYAQVHIQVNTIDGANKTKWENWKLRSEVSARNG